MHYSMASEREIHAQSIARSRMPKANLVTSKHLASNGILPRTPGPEPAKEFDDSVEFF